MVHSTGKFVPRARAAAKQFASPWSASFAHLAAAVAADTRSTPIHKPRPSFSPTTIPRSESDMSIFLACFPCCACSRRHRSNSAPDPHPPYYFDFNFYAEQMRDDVPRPRRVSSFDSISLVGDDDDDDADELTELLSSRRGGRPRGAKKSRWFEGWFSWVSSRRESRNQRSYNATSTTLSKTRTRTPSLISTASFLTPSRRNSISNFYYDETDVLNGDGSRSEQYEDYGLADAQIVPDNFVVSVPLRPTKPANTERTTDSIDEASSIYSSI